MQFTNNPRMTPGTATSSRIYGFWRSLIFAVVLALASMLGIFEPFDGLIHDAFVRSAPGAATVTRKVVLVEVPASSFTDASIRWDTLADNLIARGAAQVVFTALPVSQREAADALLKKSKVVVGARLRSGADLAEKPLPGASSPPESVPRHAAAVIADPVLGVHRSQRYNYRLGDRDVPGLEAMTASRLGITVPAEGRYLIDFRDSASGFPRATLGQLLHGDVSASVLHDRVVLIGPALEDYRQTVITPLTKSGREVSELEYHGYALDTLLRGTSLASFSPGLLAALAIGIWLVCLPILHPMPFRRAVLTACIMATVLALLSWLLLSKGIRLPVLGPILVVVSSLVAIFQSKTESQNQALARLATETNLAATGRLAGHSVPFDDAFWSNVLAMIDQVLPVARVVLLERVERSKQVREVHSLRCSADAVQERRRDFRRAPYSTAVESGKAIEVRNYLMDTEPGEHQFISPLVWNGQVLGFWAFGLRRSRMMDRLTLMRAVDILSKQLSELMYARRRSMAQPAIRAGWRDRLADRRDLSIQKLTQHVNMIDRHINVLEDMFNGMDVPAMVYDLFGRPLLSNTGMKALLQAAQVDAEAQSAADLLEAVCTLSSGEVRAVLLGVVFNGDRFERTAHVGSTRYRLLVSRLHNSGARSNLGHEVLQHTHGLMIQLFPVANPNMHQGDRPERALRLIGSVRRQPSEAGVREVEEEVDVLNALEEAIASIAAAPEHETLSFAVTVPHRNAKVLAQPRKLNDILTTLIRFLAEDSRQQGKITVNVDTEADGLIIGLRNNGFGMPDDKLQAMLDGTVLPRSDYLRRIRLLRDSAFGNHGQLDLRSTVGGGYVAKATMRLAG